MMGRCLAALIACATCIGPVLAGQGRVTQSLDGDWAVGETVDGDVPPVRFAHRVPVPGLVHLAHPAFADVDQYESRSFLANMIVNGLRPASARTDAPGVTRQHRNFFWYRTSFVAPSRHARAFIRIGKAQFGSELWVNGRRIGGSAGCAASRTYDVTAALHWAARNAVMIRIGAHPGVLPPGSPCGVDMEKTRWTPGLYDDVTAFFTGPVTIATTQVAPHLWPQAITVETMLRNDGSVPVAAQLRLAVHGWNRTDTIGTAETAVQLAPNETRTVRQEIALPAAETWSPDHPRLYVVESRVDGDSTATRFGLREFRFDTASRQALLNGRPIFLRGSNIALHRFFEDPQSGRLPWDDAWVGKLLGETARSMHWNAMRFTIGPVPDRWLEIADEQGLIVQQEYPIWNSKLIGPANPTFDSKTLIDEFAGWMRDGWNHPSVAIWDASNETDLPQLARDVIPAVRPLDLSGRAWENSYSPPNGADDPVEDHPYEFVTNEYPEIGPPFDMIQLERRSGGERDGRTVPTGHAMILNEYGWLWLTRQGDPTLLTRHIYASLPYPTATAQDRLRTQAYLLAGLTEYWRAYRRYAGIMHFVYLTGEVPDGFTSDNFADVTALRLNPYFRDYVGEAFRPLGVYVNFWQRTLPVGSAQDYTVMLVNDEVALTDGDLVLTFEDEGGHVRARAVVPYTVQGSGQTTLRIGLAAPAVPGHYVLKATAVPRGGGQATVSRRWVTLT